MVTISSKLLFIFALGYSKIFLISFNVLLVLSKLNALELYYLRKNIDLQSVPHLDIEIWKDSKLICDEGHGKGKLPSLSSEQDCFTGSALIVAA